MPNGRPAIPLPTILNRRHHTRCCLLKEGFKASLCFERGQVDTFMLRVRTGGYGLCCEYGQVDMDYASSADKWI